MEVGILFRSLLGPGPAFDADASARRLASEAATVLSSGGEEALAVWFHERMGRVANDLTEVDVAVTGLGWLMGQVRSVEQVTLDVLDHTERELLITGYSLRASAASFWEHFADRLRAGVVCRMAVNNVGGQPSDVQRLLHGFGREFGERFVLYDFPPSDDRLAGLHAKVIVADRSVAIVGSANLTFHGMAMAHELAVRLRGAAAAEVAYRVDDLLGSRVIHRYSG